MTAWFLKLIGLSNEFVTPRGEASLRFQHAGWLWCLLALLPIGYWIYARQRNNLTTVPYALRIALSGTRIIILALMLVVLSGPYLQLHYESEKKPIVAFLFDHSQSMQLEAGPFESEDEIRQTAQAAGYKLADGKVDPETRKALNKISRAKLAQSVVQTSAPTLLAPLSKKYDVHYYSVAQDVKEIGVDALAPKFEEPPKPREGWGSSTFLGDAMAQVLSEAGDRKVAGIVLFTDGQNTGGRSPLEVAQLAAAADAPILAVQTGVTRRLKDIAIVDVYTSGLVSVGDTVGVAVTIESQGFDKRPVKVELKEGDKLLDSKDLILRSSEQQHIELTFQAKEAGARYLTVNVPVQPEEPKELHVNNSDVAFVRVSDEKLKVLYVEGLPRWDYRFLKNAMRRDHGLGGRSAKEPDVVLEAEVRRLPTDQQAQALPRTAKELAEYHTIILGDVSPRLLTPEFVKLLVEAVREHGVGLVVEAGPLHMPHDFDKDLFDLLPVRLDRKALGGYQTVNKPYRLQLTPEGAIHEATRFHDDPGRNQNAWTHMPPYYWCIAAERPSPSASVLVWNPSITNNYGKLPLVTSHYAGKGKVMLVGTDSTWLWRQNVGDRFFYKFWGQALRYVARREQTALKKSWIEARPFRVQPGEQVQIELMALTSDGSPRTESKQVVQVLGDKRPEKIELAADPVTKGRYLGKVTPKGPGDYRVRFEPGVGSEAIEARIRALAAAEELRHPNVNRPALEMLAAASKKNFLIEPAEFDTIADKLEGESKTMKLDREASLWDNWLTLSLLVFVYSLDVGLRRLVGLS